MSRSIASISLSLPAFDNPLSPSSSPPQSRRKRKYTSDTLPANQEAPLFQSKLHQFQSQIIYLANLINAASQDSYSYERLIVLELERVMRQMRENGDGFMGDSVDVSHLDVSNGDLRPDDSTGGIRASNGFLWRIWSKITRKWSDSSGIQTPTKHSTPAQNATTHLQNIRMRYLAAGHLLDSPNMVPSPMQFPTTPVYRHDKACASPVQQQASPHLQPQSRDLHQSSHPATTPTSASDATISSRSYWKLVTMPLLLHTALALVQIYCSIRLSAKSAKLTRLLMDNRFRSFLWNVIDSAFLSTFVALVASTKESLRLRMTTEIFLHSVRKSCVDIFHYELQKAWSRKFVHFVCSGVENVLGVCCYSIALARLSGIVSPTLLVSYVVLQKALLSLFRPQNMYKGLHAKMHCVFMQFADFLWKDEHTDVNFFETTKRAHPRNSREQIVRMFTEYCSLQSKLYRLDLVYKDVLGGFLQRNMPLIVSWTYTAILVSMGNMKFMTHAELASLFRFMGALISHHIHSTHNVVSLVTQYGELRRISNLSTAWQCTYSQPHVSLFQLNQAHPVAQTDANSSSTANDLSLSTISLALMTPTKNQSTVIEAIRLTGPIPNLHSSLTFTPNTRPPVHGSPAMRATHTQLDAKRLSLTSNIHQSAEWIIDYCIRTDMNVLVTTRKSAQYEELLHRIVWVANQEGITHNVHRKEALFIQPTDTVRSFLCHNRQHLIENPPSDSEIDRLLSNTGLADIVEISKHDFNLPFSQWSVPRLTLRQLQKLCLTRILFWRPTFCLLDLESVEALSRQEWSTYKKSFLKRNIVVVRFSRYETDDIFTSPPKANIEKNNPSKRDTLWNSVALFENGLLSEMPQMGYIPSPPRDIALGRDEHEESESPEQPQRSVRRRRSKSLHTDVVTESTFYLDMDDELIREINYRE